MMKSVYRKFVLTYFPQIVSNCFNIVVPYCFAKLSENGKPDKLLNLCLLDSYSLIVPEENQSITYLKPHRSNIDSGVFHRIVSLVELLITSLATSWAWGHINFSSQIGAVSINDVLATSIVDGASVSRAVDLNENCFVSLVVDTLKGRNRSRSLKINSKVVRSFVSREAGSRKNGLFVGDDRLGKLVRNLFLLKAKFIKV